MKTEVMPPLNLASWEIPEGMVASPEGEAHAAHFIPWVDGPCMVLFRCVEVSPQRWVIFARAAESEEEGNWLVCNRNSQSLVVNRDETHLVVSLEDDAPYLNKVKYIKNVVRLLQSDDSPIDFMRLVVVKGQVHYAVLSSNGTGRWINWEYIIPQAPFRIPLLSGSLANAAEDNERLLCELANPDSDASFSLKWSSLSSEEQMELLCGGKQAINEIKQVMMWTLKAQRSLWEHGEHWNWQITNNYSNPSLGFYPTDIRDHFPDVEDKIPLLVHVGHVVLEDYLGARSGALREQHPCIQDYDEWPTVWLNLKPTAHEQLEARLQLREWLKSHASAEKFAELEKYLN